MNEPRPSRTSLRRPLLGAALAWLAVVATLVVAAVVAQDYFTVREVATPTLVGLPLAEAERTAQEAGVRLRTYPVDARTARPEAVVEQTPVAGAVVRRGREVSVGVNVPAEADRMPTLVGAREADAVAALNDLNLPSADVTYTHVDAPRGQVVAQAPAAGQPVPPGGDVRLEVSRGPAAAQVELPDVTGLEVEAARAQLTALGVRRVEAVAVDVSMLRPGTVLRQRPEGGTVVPVGAPVTLGYALQGDEVAEVPDVAGLEPWRARVALISAGFELGPIEVVARPDAPAGVVEARPSGLTLAGAPVALVINAPDGDAPDVDELRTGADPRDGIGIGIGDGDARQGDGASVFGRDGGPGDASSDGRTVPFRFDPRDLGVRALVDRDYELRLVVRDAEGERTVLDRVVPAGEPVRTTVVVRGDEPLLQTYVNGVFFQAWRP